MQFHPSKNVPDRAWPGTKGTQSDDDFNQGRYALRMLGGYGRTRARGRLRALRRSPPTGDFRKISEEKASSSCSLQNNVLIGVRGKGGGYRLNGTPDQFTVRRILEITEGSLAAGGLPVRAHEPCARMANCRTYPMWRKGAPAADLRLSGQLYPRGFDETRRRGV